MDRIIRGWDGVPTGTLFLPKLRPPKSAGSLSRNRQPSRRNRAAVALSTSCRPANDAELFSVTPRPDPIGAGCLLDWRAGRGPWDVWGASFVPRYALVTQKTLLGWAIHQDTAFLTHRVIGGCFGHGDVVFRSAVAFMRSGEPFHEFGHAGNMRSESVGCQPADPAVGLICQFSLQAFQDLTVETTVARKATKARQPSSTRWRDQMSDRPLFQRKRS
jgi:hypothetical protein